MWILIIIIILLIIAYIYYRSKQLKLPNVYLVTGGVKTGKSFLSVCLSIKKYKRNLFIWKITNFFCKILRKQPKEKPELYSNMHLRNIPYTLLTKEILYREKRLPYKSVVLIDEVALTADSMSYKDNNLNERLTLFVKLFGHETRGGTLILNTQSLMDCHYAFKRGLQSYIWIHSRQKFPIVSRFQVREMVFNNENGTANNFNEDIEKSTTNLWILNKWYKYYDCYCYSIFTDNLPIHVNTEKRTKYDSLKTNVIVSFKEYQSLKDFYQKNNTNDLKVSISNGNDSSISNVSDLEISINSTDLLSSDTDNVEKPTATN